MLQIIKIIEDLLILQIIKIIEVKIVHSSVKRNLKVIVTGERNLFRCSVSILSYPKTTASTGFQKSKNVEMRANCSLL